MAKRGSEEHRQKLIAGGKKSSRKGVPNKDTKQLHARLDELGCDPLELSAMIAMGAELDGPHPAHGLLHKLVAEWAKLLDKGEPLTLDHLEQLTDLADTHLAKGYVPYDLRSKHIVDLMRYVYPQRKAVELEATIEDRSPRTLDPGKLSTTALQELLAAQEQAARHILEGELDDDEPATSAH